MSQSRRGFLGSLLGIAAIPFLPKKSEKKLNPEIEENPMMAVMTADYRIVSCNDAPIGIALNNARKGQIVHVQVSGITKIQVG